MTTDTTPTPQPAEATAQPAPVAAAKKFAITKGRKITPIFMVLYGTAGIGKSTLAAGFKNALVVQTEEGSNSLDVDKLPVCKSFQDVVDQLTAIGTDPMYAEYKTVIMDSLDQIEPLIWNVVCAEGFKKNITDFKFGDGYEMALGYWRKLTNYLMRLRDAKGMNIVCIAHPQVKRYDSPKTDSYDRYELRLNKKAAAHFTDIADILAFADYDTHTVETHDEERKRGIGTGVRKLFLEERPAFIAKNRFGMPAEIPLSFSAFAEAYSKAINPTTTATK